MSQDSKDWVNCFGCKYLEGAWEAGNYEPVHYCTHEGKTMKISFMVGLCTNYERKGSVRWGEKNLKILV